MRKLIRFFYKGSTILIRRMRTQGVRTTSLWLYTRIMPYMTGVPIFKYSEITPQLYVGPQFRQSGKRKMEILGITHSVNMRIEYNDADYDLALPNYCYLPTPDHHAPSIEHLQEGVTFIQKAIEGGAKVYIHCEGGIGRAPSMAVAYFISQGHSVEDAIQLVRQKRAFINMTAVQVARLREFEELVRNNHPPHPAEGKTQ